LVLNNKKVLVLGSGGASATAVAVLMEMGADVVVISRNGSDNYTNLHRHADASVIVNATPVGMYPDVDASPVSLDIFPKLEGVLDLIYNPCRTNLLQQAEARGLLTENGLWMLVAQAKESAEWFTGRKISNDAIPEIHNMLRIQMENLILIGMPGSGKSTVGKVLAEKLNKTFVDADVEITKKAGISIPEIFSLHGESGFRMIETEVLSTLGRRSGLVIATGGGCVTREENYPLLHRNGTIIWVQRDLEQLPVDGRPLSKAGNLMQIYSIREPLYNAFSDLKVANTDSPEDTANTILSLLNLEV
jgi:shikimate dehydrogenase